VATDFSPQWAGPVVYFSGAGPAPSCPSDWTTVPVEGVSGGFVPPAAHTCNDCSCGGPTGQNCAPGSIQFWDTAGCTGVGSNVQAQATTCTEISPSAGVWVAARANPPTVTGGSCAASGGGVENLPAWSGAGDALVCGSFAGAGGCAAATETCVRQPEAPFEQSVCIVRSGNRSCSGLGAYTQPRTVYDVVDTRTCSGCSCGSPQGASCTGLSEAHTDLACPGAGTAVAADGTTCTAVSSPVAFDFSPGIVTPGACTPGGGLPTGGVAADQFTLCCLP
jgi:hypothetical protein